MQQLSEYVDSEYHNKNARVSSNHVLGTKAMLLAALPLICQEYMYVVSILRTAVLALFDLLDMA